MFTIKPATPDDMLEVVELQRKSLRDTLGVVIRTMREDVAYYCYEVLQKCTVLVAVADEVDVKGVIVGYIGFRKDWVDHLRVDVSYHGLGIGKALLEKAKEDYPYLQLWCFQHIPAREFYHSQGFVEVEYTDGDNDEKLPDVRMEWKR
jgi:GNAT superfamily N-acetyltransferase